MTPKPIILDISEWQVPTKINYAQLSQQISGVIVRVQYGSNYEDKHYKTHITEFKKYNIPVAAYAWVRGTSVTDMEKEARDFYQRAKNFQPTFWWLDVEEHSMRNMRQGVEAYRQQLKKLGAKKVGAYIANHLFKQFKLDTAKFDAIWLPTYGVNNGQYNGSNPTATNDYHIHQYSDRGRLSGYSGYLDLNRIAKGKLADYFGEGNASIKIFKVRLNLVDTFERIYAPISLAIYGAIIMLALSFISTYGFSMLFVLFLVLIFFLISVSFVANLWRTENLSPNKNRFYWTIGALILAGTAHLIVNLLLSDMIGASIAHLFEEIIDSIFSSMFY